MENQPIIIGYWKVRGKGHVLRMILQYLLIPYTEVIYEYPWSFFDQEQQIAHMAQNLPYIKDGDIMVFDLLPCFVYISQKYKNQEIMGKNIKDRAVVDMFDWDIQYLFKKLFCVQFWDMFKSDSNSIQQKILKSVIEPVLKKCQFSLQTSKKWYFGYLSVIDFHLCSMCDYIEVVFPGKLLQYPKIKQIATNVKNIFQIKQLQKQPKIRNLCFFPTQMCKNINIKREG